MYKDNSHVFNSKKNLAGVPKNVEWDQEVSNEQSHYTARTPSFETKFDMAPELM